MSSLISVVIPVYNDAPVLPFLLERLAPVLFSLDADSEIICVDDASTDGSFELLHSLQKGHPDLHLLRLAANAGQSNAITAGIEYAHGGRIVVMDSDLEDPPEAIPSLLAALDSAPLALAQDSGRWERGWRGVNSMLFCLLSRILTSLASPANVGVFRAFTRAGLDAAMANSKPEGTTLSRFYAAKIPYALVPIARGHRVAGTSSYTFFKRFHLACTRICTYHRIPFLRTPHRPHYTIAKVITP